MDPWILIPGAAHISDVVTLDSSPTFLDMAILRSSTATFKRMYLRDSSLVPKYSGVYLVEVANVLQPHLHAGVIYANVGPHPVLEVMHSCYSESSNSGSPVIDRYGYPYCRDACFRIQCLQAYATNRGHPRFLGGVKCC